MVNIISAITGNFKTSCEYCGKRIKKKDAYTKTVKLLEFVYPKPASFCNKRCCNSYKAYEESIPKRASLCPSCPTHPDA